LFLEESIVKEAEREVVLKKTKSMKKICVEKHVPNYMALMPYSTLIRDLHLFVGLT